MSPNLSIFFKSSYLSSRTRSLLQERTKLEHKTPSNLSTEAYYILQTLCNDILPQNSLLPNHQTINLAALIDHDLNKIRDGWRFVELPSDQNAWEIGLMTLQAYAHFYHQQSYSQLTIDERGQLLDLIYDTKVPSLSHEAVFSSSQMALWYRDARAEVVNTFLSHPVAQDALQISSNLTGGDEEVF